MLCISFRERRPISDQCGNSQVVLLGKLPEAPCSISLCPQATSVALGYEGAVKIYNIVLESLVESYSFETDAHPEVCFSPSGHLIAFTKGSEICLYYSSGFKAHTSFQRHKAKVQNLIWRHDKCLLSSDAAGAIYEWDLPRKRASWKHTLPEVTHTCMATPKNSPDELFVVSSDGNIRCLRDGKEIDKCSTNVSEVTAMVVVDELVLVGSTEGKLVGFELSLRFPIFEISHHIGSIVHLVEFREGTSIMALDTYGIASTWKFEDKNYTGRLPSRTELLINVDKREEFVREIRAMEVMLRGCTEKADLERQQLLSEHEGKEAEALQKHRDIQSALQSSLDKLKDELETIKEYWETKDVIKIKEIQREKEENESDFQLKMVEEEKCLLRAKEERTRLQEDFEQSVAQRQEERQAVIEDFGIKCVRHQRRIAELQQVLEKENCILSDVKQEREDFDKFLVEEANTINPPVIGPETYSDIRIKTGRHKCLEQIEATNAQVSYQKEICRTMEDVFKKKHNLFQQLQNIAEELKVKVNQALGDINRIEKVLDNKSVFSSELEHEAEELSVEGNLKIEECEEELSAKKRELVELKKELHKCREHHYGLTTKLRILRREETVQNERLQSTEKSVMDNSRQLMAAELLLERYRQEFINSTSDCPSTLSLRWAILRLYEKRVSKTHIREENVFVVDTDPYVRFCSQRDHYENLINVIRSRTAQIRSTFREYFVKLAKVSCFHQKIRIRQWLF
ncbi:cilia-and flagella-associated protein 57 [Caerostris darwini]|uniref:Cilia-and flagella-associated protein 57 n=1 Tax=Caerostris darwini TaxID=1538125 RepID=A0AAV4QZQ1_9ARAC|nr:cilia-and flagella-associated protein 57 [Caerostris darwini]